MVHLFERDCSVQLRNQKVLEIAPAPNVDPALRAQLHADAIKLAKASNYSCAGTVEFLVQPDSGEYFFIECNPRIQVEHTVTEQVTGIDLVESQFKIASGSSLADLGLSQETISTRGYSIQARVVATGTGTLTSYKEPSGAGIRVDGSGYVGYTPAPQFDPLLAKVICSHPAENLQSSIDRSIRALEEFHIDGVATNLAPLVAILQHPDFQGGDCRTSLLTDYPELMLTTEVGSKTSDLLAAQVGPAGPASSASQTSNEAVLPPLEVGAGEEAVECPVGGLVVELRVAVGDAVNVGDPVIVVSAMKTETLVESTVSGLCVSVQSLESGDKIGSGDMVAVIDTEALGSVWSSGADLPEAETWDYIMKDIALRHQMAIDRLNDPEDPGVARQKSRGKLTCRERIDLLLDDGSFREIGSAAGFAAVDDDGFLEDFIAASHVGGKGKIEGRDMVCCADDFTSRGGHADGAVGAKSMYMDRLATHLQIPMIRLLDGSSGGGSPPKVTDRSPAARLAAARGNAEPDAELDAAQAELAAAEQRVEQRIAELEEEMQEQRELEKLEKEDSGRVRAGGGWNGGMPMPGHQGGDFFASQLNTVPVVTMLLGSVVGIGAAKAMVTHFCVMVKDISQLFVAGPPVVKETMNYDITKEDLGDWKIHATNGSVDNLADSEEDAVWQTRRFLSYLPSNVYEKPPIYPSNPADPPFRKDEELNTLIPRKKTTTFDIRRGIELMADRDSFFEIGTHWGTDQVTGFVRFDGYPVGVVGSDSRHINGGALTADGCEKLIRFMDICDVFHIPLLNLCDNPGFAVGLEHEIKSTIRKGAEWMIAWSHIKVPVFTVLMRRSFGVGGNNYTSPQSNTGLSRVTWPSAEAGSLPAEGGVEAAYKAQLNEAEEQGGPEAREAFKQNIMDLINAQATPMRAVSNFGIEQMIYPAETRRYICEWIGLAYNKLGQATDLGPRPLMFRP